MLSVEAADRVNCPAYESSSSECASLCSSFLPLPDHTVRLQFRLPQLSYQLAKRLAGSAPSFQLFTAHLHGIQSSHRSRPSSLFKYLQRPHECALQADIYTAAGFGRSVIVPTWGLALTFRSLGARPCAPLAGWRTTPSRIGRASRSVGCPSDSGPHGLYRDGQQAHRAAGSDRPYPTI